MVCPTSIRSSLHPLRPLPRIRLGAALAPALAFGLAAGPPLAGAATAGATGFAVAVVEYVPGDGAVPGYQDPSTALGPPTRFTGGVFDPMVVSAFNPPWRPEEVVSIGAGGRLVLELDPPASDDPRNPWGVDLLVFGNALLVDCGSLDGVSCDPAKLAVEGGIVEVSADGATWHVVEGVVADGAMPTVGWQDADGPYAMTPGTIPTDARRPVAPSVTLEDLGGLTEDEIKHLYCGSAGGAGIDLASVGLATARYVRISSPEDAAASPEVDAVASVRPLVPGDVDGDLVVDVGDLLGLLERWGPSQPGGWDADFDCDGVVAVDDLLVLLAGWSDA